MSRRRVVRTAILSLVLAVTLPALPAGTAPQSGPSRASTDRLGVTSGAAVPGLFRASAFGTLVRVGQTVKSGATAAVGLGGCGTFDANVSRGNSVASVDLAPTLTTGAIVTTAETIVDAEAQRAKSTATVSDLDVLSGLITATEARAVSQSFDAGSGPEVSAEGSMFVDLKVGGVSIIGEVDPNTRMELLGFGHVVLNEQKVRAGANGASLTVNMVHVVIDTPNPIVEVGTEIFLAHAASGFGTSIRGTVGGFAYGTSVDADLISSGPSALVALGCLGTDGAEKTNTVAEVTVPPALEVGTVTNTVSGLVTAQLSTSDAMSTIEAIDVAGGTVTADVITAHASVSNDGSVVTRSHEGSTFTNIRVGGVLIGDEVAPNTRIRLEELGTLWLYRVVTTQYGLEVRMIELLITEDNPIGLLPGTRIRVAVAHARAQHAAA